MVTWCLNLVWCPSTESVAWFFLGDGTGGLVLAKAKKTTLGFRIYPRCSFSNNDEEVLSLVEQWLKRSNIKSSKTPHTGENSQKPNYRLSIDRYTQVEKFLHKVLPFLCGYKRKVCVMLLDFIEKFKREPSPFGRAYRSEPLEAKRKRFLAQVEYYENLHCLQGHINRPPKYSREYFLNLWDGGE